MSHLCPHGCRTEKEDLRALIVRQGEQIVRLQTEQREDQQLMEETNEHLKLGTHAIKVLAQDRDAWRVKAAILLQALKSLLRVVHLIIPGCDDVFRHAQKVATDSADYYPRYVELLERTVKMVREGQEASRERLAHPSMSLDQRAMRAAKAVDIALRDLAAYEQEWSLR